MRAARTSPCARHGRPPARSVCVPLRAARRGRRALPAGASRSTAGAARAHGGHGGVCGRGRRPRRPASPERPRARSVRVPLRAARRGRRALPAGTSRSPAWGGTGAWRPRGVCGRGRRPRRPASRNVPVRAGWTSPCARRAEDVAPYQPAHPGPPPGAARAHGGHGGVCGRGRRPRRPASTGTSPCAHGHPRARSVRVPLRAARRGRRALPADASQTRRGGTGAWRPRGHLW